MKLYAYWKGKRWELDIVREHDHIVVTHGGKQWRLLLDDHRTHIKSCLVDSKKLDFGWVRRGEQYQIVIGGVPLEITVKDQRSERIESMKRTVASSDQIVELCAPIPGLISRVLVAEGQRVAKNQPLMTLDAMKMENEILSTKDGVVSKVFVQPAQTVDKGQVLAVIS